MITIHLLRILSLYHGHDLMASPCVELDPSTVEHATLFLFFTHSSDFIFKEDVRSFGLPESSELLLQMLRVLASKLKYTSVYERVCM